MCVCVCERERERERERKRERIVKMYNSCVVIEKRQENKLLDKQL